MGEETAADRYARPFVGMLVLAGLYVISIFNYPLFHNLSHMFSVIIAFGVFMVAWNARHVMKNNYLLFLGVSFLFVGGLDLLHVLAHGNMGLLATYSGRNLACQFRILARCLQSASFLIAIFFIRRRMDVTSVFAFYFVITAFLILDVLYWHVLPESVLAVSGPADSAKMSAAVVSVIFAISIALLLYRRKDFDRRVLSLLLASVIAAVITETFFMFRRSPGGPTDIIGHFTGIASFYFIYVAIIRTGIENPYDLLFRELKQNESLLRKERDRAQTYLDIAEVLFVVISADETVGLVNKKSLDFLGFPEKDIIGRNWFDNFLPERLREERRDVFRKTIKGAITPVLYHEDPVVTRSGEERMIAWHTTVIDDAGGHNIGTLSSGIDVTGSKKTEEMLKESESRLKAITLALEEGVYILDRAGCLVFMNRGAENILRWKEHELKGRRVHDLIHAHKTAADMRHPDECPIIQIVNSGEVCRIDEEVFVRKDGTLFPVTLVAAPVRSMEGVTGSVVAFRDITARKRTEEALRRANELLAHRATTDALTGIYNRLKFNGLLDMEIRKASRYKIPLSLIMFDIDNFKDINDKYGHQTGDSVLKEIARLVAHNIRDADLFARWGGEEFMILAPENELRNALHVAEKLRIKIEAHQFGKAGRVTCSFGVTQFTVEDTVVSLAKRADEAMYAAKGKGKNRTETR